MGLKIGIDVGGTFTKAVLIDNATHEVVGRFSVLTTHSDPRGVAKGVVDVFRNVLEQSGVDPKEVIFLAHSTTQATGQAQPHGRQIRAISVMPSPVWTSCSSMSVEPHCGQTCSWNSTRYAPGTACRRDGSAAGGSGPGGAPSPVLPAGGALLGLDMSLSPCFR